MALDSPILKRVVVMAAALETTTGTAASLSGSTGVFNATKHKISAKIPASEREAQGSISSLPPVPGARWGTAAFRTEIYNTGTGTVPQWLSALLVACGWVGSAGVYTPQTGASATATIGIYEGGSRLKTLVGAQGSFKISGESGNPLFIDWNFEGVWVPPTTTAIIAPTYPTITPPRFAGATFTLGGTAYRIKKFDFDMGNKITPREDATQASGYHAGIVASRKPVFKFDPEALPLGTQDWYAAHLASTTYALSCAVGSGSNNIITIAAPALQLLNPPEDGDRGGILTDELEFLATTNAGAADSELSITAS